MYHQILIFSACSLALGASSVYCNGKFTPATVSYPQLAPRTPINNQQGLLKSSSERHVADFNQAASSAQSGYSPSLTQPSVYHSIIDRTATEMTRQTSPAVQASTSTIGDLHTAAGHHHGHAHGKYYEYRAVPKKKTWKFGYKRGNHKHTISRHEHGKAGKHPHFKTKVKWHDKKSKGKGIHLWDYNHHDKKHYYGHHG